MTKFKGSLALIFTLIFMAVGCANAPSVHSVQLKDEHYFTLKNLDGNDVVLADLLKEKKAVLLNFWATWCPPCREEIPGLIKLQNQNQDKGFTILGVDVGESSKKVSAFSQKMKMNYPIVLDEDMKVSEKYGIVGIPTSLLINSKGEVIGKYHAYTKKLIADVERAVA